MGVVVLSALTFVVPEVLVGVVVISALTVAELDLLSGGGWAAGGHGRAGFAASMPSGVLQANSKAPTR